MVSATRPPLKKTVGQPPIQAWEQWRAIAWAHEVQRQAQTKMGQMPLPASDPFAKTAKLIQARWSKPQRKTQNPNIVTFNDLGEVFLGAQRTGFYKYAKGERARPKPTVISAVDEVLAGTRSMYDLGPEGIPVWAALAGIITVDDFWRPLVLSGQVSDALELGTGWFDWIEADVRAPQPNLVSDGKDFVIDASLQSSMRYEASVIIPTLPWASMVHALSARFSTFRDPDEAFSARMVESDSVTLGEATLAVALAQIALRDPEASVIAKEVLRQILIGLIPFWTRFDSTTPTPQSTVALTVRHLASLL